MTPGAGMTVVVCTPFTVCLVTQSSMLPAAPSPFASTPTVAGTSAVTVMAAPAPLLVSACAYGTTSASPASTARASGGFLAMHHQRMCSSAAFATLLGGDCRPLRRLGTQVGARLLETVRVGGVDRGAGQVGSLAVRLDLQRALSSVVGDELQLGEDSDQAAGHSG